MQDKQIERRFDMRILLQHIRNRLYFRRRGVGTSDMQTALDFQNSERAIEFARAFGLQAVQIAVEPERQRRERVRPPG